MTAWQQRFEWLSGGTKDKHRDAYFEDDKEVVATILQDRFPNGGPTRRPGIRVVLSLPARLEVQVLLPGSLGQGYGIRCGCSAHFFSMARAEELRLAFANRYRTSPDWRWLFSAWCWTSARHEGRRRACEPSGNNRSGSRRRFTVAPAKPGCRACGLFGPAVLASCHGMYSGGY